MAILASDAELGEQVSHKEELWKVLTSQPDVASHDGEKADQPRKYRQAIDEKKLNAN
jgi:hypothetical protein